jgi:hypothetical protein
MRRISAVRGMTFGLKYQPRQVFWSQVFWSQVFWSQVFWSQVFRDSGARDNVARDNEEAIIGTQLRFGMGDCHTRWLAESEGR